MPTSAIPENQTRRIKEEDISELQKEVQEKVAKGTDPEQAVVDRVNKHNRLFTQAKTDLKKGIKTAKDNDALLQFEKWFTELSRLTIRDVTEALL